MNSNTLMITAGGRCDLYCTAMEPEAQGGYITYPNKVTGPLSGILGIYDIGQSLRLLLGQNV